ncbi:hypothetical protein TNCV_2817011 [Trichonephila clavipes]|nr:hypothetical protein TNCV_2817011 [Trichonephila clavipes]
MVSWETGFFYFCSLADFVRDVEALMELHVSWTSHGPLHTTTRLQQDYDAPDIISGCTLLHHGQNPYRIQTAPGYYNTDKLLRCFSEITTLQTFFSFFLPSRRGRPFANQESVNQESVKCRLNGRRVCLN